MTIPGLWSGISPSCLTLTFPEQTDFFFCLFLSFLTNWPTNNVPSFCWATPAFSSSSSLIPGWQGDVEPPWLPLLENLVLLHKYWALPRWLRKGSCFSAFPEGSTWTKAAVQRPLQRVESFSEPRGLWILYRDRHGSTLAHHVLRRTKGWAESWDFQGKKQLPPLFPDIQIQMLFMIL